MERDFGRQFVQRNKQYLQAYAVESLDGHTITAGWRFNTEIAANDLAGRQETLSSEGARECWSR